MPPNRAEALRERRRREIVAAAREVFAIRGYHAASIDHVIERAGIARGTFYLYFEGKHDVFESLLEEALAELRARIKRVDLGPGAMPPHVQLRGSLVRALEYVLENPHFTRLLLGSWMNPDPEVAGTVDAFYRHVEELIARSIKHGMRLGLVRRIDASLVAAALLGTVRGITGKLLESKKKPPIERAVDEIIALVIAGIGSTGRW